jgi:hypothetical protein
VVAESCYRGCYQVIRLRSLVHRNNSRGGRQACRRNAKPVHWSNISPQARRQPRFSVAQLTFAIHPFVATGHGRWAASTCRETV